ncbi:UDP-2,4-diacetamido-2,4,6-trideoxy-beta-L-altropyranose hydrolase [Gelidibacter maritimus]|uniref:UDP-2,4-diacetamido-2,4, 6-trideoxy-beta-L-altropyranose hydrolase n=1 Tax=Gelidibacter maritimus TaxID=2761487 RepID=A0A7W2M3E5_9FLAO|nr:UDP-2,4-diacetamido-2,4,6-trideoxy-beta-L-altropyranose hydrolase [Gelidibacter maritimus]MBA6151935.1 UDP-2,4-diacetamido-2,4,6-trideoxy-beta-L-altropyranose hydrolase [Gelidibacter maritimus]
MAKKILFRADGNTETGLGHLYRLFALVEIYKEQYQFVFLTKQNSILDIIPKDYLLATIPDEIKMSDEPQWIHSHFPPQKYILIADGYQFTATYQQQIKNRGYSLIYIDDLATDHMYADVVINHSPYIQEGHYKKEAYTRLALGTQYALLRPLFLESAKLNREVNSIHSAFVCFGGADPFNLTIKAVKALLEIQNFKNIYVVLGGAYKHDDIFKLEEEHSDRIKIYNNLSEDNLVKTMEQCNFAIAPASTILYELCCVKMPVLSGFYVDNQELIYKGFLNHNAIIDGGNFQNYQVSNFIDHLKLIVYNQQLNHYIMAQKALFDDKISERHLNIIKKL